MLYADTSVLVRAYLADEPEHDSLRRLLLESNQRVLSSELARVEFARAITAAARARRVPRADWLLSSFDYDCGEGGPLTLLELRPRFVFSGAYELVREHRLGTLDALHLAVALNEATTIADGDLVFVTRDADQAAAATALGLAVA